MTTLTFRGIWGFKIVPNDTVGGGLFAAVRMEQGEHALDYLLASRSGPGWLDTHGYLTVTDRRVIFTPYRLPFIGRPTVLRYADVFEVHVARKGNPGNPASFMLDSIVFRLRSDHFETFQPTTPAEQLVRLIRARLRT